MGIFKRTMSDIVEGLGEIFNWHSRDDKIHAEMEKEGWSFIHHYPCVPFAEPVVIIKAPDGNILNGKSGTEINAQYKECYTRCGQKLGLF